jgi:hypothetical protein
MLLGTAALDQHDFALFAEPNDWNAFFRHLPKALPAQKHGLKPPRAIDFRTVDREMLAATANSPWPIRCLPKLDARMPITRDRDGRLASSTNLRSSVHRLGTPAG